MNKVCKNILLFGIWLLGLIPAELFSQGPVFFDTVCPGDTRRYRVIGKHDENLVLWIFTGASVLSDNPTQADTVLVHWPDSAGVYSIRVVESDTGFNCYGLEATGRVVIGSDIKQTFTLGNDRTICEGESVLLDAGQGYKDYLWSDNSRKQSLLTLQGGMYSATVTDNYSCSDADTVIVTVNERPQNLWTVSKVCDNSGQSPDPGLHDSYLWSTGEISRYIIIPYHTDYVWLTVKNDKGCSDTDTLYIDHCFEAIPTAFSPNNDGINDTWEIPWLQYEFPDARIYVFNRAGVLVFQSDKGYRTPWDGRYKGIILPFDSYHFILEHNDGVNSARIGQVTIIK